MCVEADLLGELHGLQSQLPGGGQDEGTGTSLGAGGLQLLKHGDQERCRLPTARPSHGNHVLAIQDDWDGLQAKGRATSSRETR